MPRSWVCPVRRSTSCQAESPGTTTFDPSGESECTSAPAGRGLPGLPAFQTDRRIRSSSWASSSPAGCSPRHAAAGYTVRRMNASAAVGAAVNTVAYPQTSRRYSSRPDPTASFTDPMTSRAAICHSYRLAITDHSCSGFSRRCWAALLASEGAAHGDGSRPEGSRRLKLGPARLPARGNHAHGSDLKLQL
jgi:hypothetical protein